MENNHPELEFIRKRGNILILFEKLTQLPLLIATILFSIYAGTKMDYQLISAAAFIAISPFIQLMKYAFTYYTIKDEQLIVESGLWNKKRIEIPLRSVTTVDLTQNILYQIFKTYKIKVDNGSQAKGAANAAEVQFALKADLAFQFKHLVENDLQARAGDKTEEGTKASVTAEAAGKSVGESTQDQKARENPLPVIASSPLDYIQLGLLESKLIYILSFIPILSAAAYFLSGIGVAPGEDEIVKIMEKLLTVIPIGLAVILAILILFFCGLVFSIFRSVMTYFGFQISADAKKIYIEYGLLTKRKYTLQKEKISGIVFKQNLLMRIFHQYQMEVLVIGYGDKSDEEAKAQPVLFPIATKARIKEIVENILPEFSGDYYAEGDIGIPTGRKAFRYFFYQSGFVLSTLLLIGGAAFAAMSGPLPLSGGLAGSAGETMNRFIRYAPLVTGVLLEILTVGSIFLQYFNTRMAPGETITAIQSGGYHRKMTVLKMSCVENITAIASRWKLRRGISSIQIGYVAPLQTSKIRVMNRGIHEFELLEGLLDM